MRFNYKELGKYFVEPLPAVDDLAEELTAHFSEVEEIIPKGDNDWDLEIKILPDRAQDAKTPFGLAREIKALFPKLKPKEIWSLPDKKTARQEIIFTVEQINNLLGIDLTKEQIVDLLNRVRVVVETDLEAKPLLESLTSKSLVALIPVDRQDLNIKEDLADEVARLSGYDQIPTRVLTSDIPVSHNSTFNLANQIRAKLAGEGYTEIYGYTFTNQGELAVEKPLASDKSYLRDSLSTGLKKIVEFNLNRILFDEDEIKLFEIGAVFLADYEEIRIATGVGRKKPKPTIEVIEKKLTDFDLGKASDNLDSFINQQVHYRPVSIYPRIIRDLAVWVPNEIKAETVSEIIKNSASELLVESPVLFDDFSKDGRKSLAFRLVFQSSAKTLSDDEANTQITKVIEALEKQTGFEVRK